MRSCSLGMGLPGGYAPASKPRSCPIVMAGLGPGLAPPSTFFSAGTKTSDGRHKAGHDVGAQGRAAGRPV